MADNTYTQTTSNDWVGTFGSQGYSGLKLNASDAIAVGESIEQVVFYARRYGSPSGQISAVIIDSSNTLQEESTNSVDIATLGSSAYSAMPFNFNAYTLQQSDKILVKYTGGDGSNFLQAEVSTSNQIDSTSCIFFRQHDGSWTENDSWDAKFILYTNDVSGGGSGGGGSGGNGDGLPDDAGDSADGSYTYQTRPFKIWSRYN